MCIYIYIYIYIYVGPMMVLGGGAFSYERGITVHRKRPRRSLRSNTSRTKRSCSSKHGMPNHFRVKRGKLEGFTDVYLNPTPDSGLGLLGCSEFIRERWGSNTSQTKRSCSSKHGMPLSDSSWLIRVFPGTNRVRFGTRPGTNIDESDDFSWNRSLLG